MSNVTVERELCATCGMKANVDPALHHRRYRHLPRVYRDGRLYEFDYRTYAFTTQVPA